MHIDGKKTGINPVYIFLHVTLCMIRYEVTQVQTQNSNLKLLLSVHQKSNAKEVDRENQRQRRKETSRTERKVTGRIQN